MFPSVYSSSCRPSSSISHALDGAHNPLGSSAALKQMIQLTNPKIEEIPPCLDPYVFFAPFEINPRIFTNQDVELIQKLFKTIKLHPNICLFDLLGLKFYLLLKELGTSFSKELQTELTETWVAVYLQAYLNLFRESLTSHIPKTSSISKYTIPTHAYHNFLLEFTQKLTAHININLSNKLSKIKSPKMRHHLQENVKSSLAEWMALQKFLGKCLILLPSPSQILCDSTLLNSPGSEQMSPKLLDEIQQAGQNLYHYLEMISTTHYVSAKIKWSGLHNYYFENFLKEIKPLSYLKNSKEIINCAKKCLMLNSKKIFEMQKTLETLATNVARAQKGKLSYQEWCIENNIVGNNIIGPEDFLESLIQRYHQITLELCWLTDCQRILEESIVIPLDPSFHTSQAYANRILLNLQPIFQDAFSTMLPSHNNELSQQKSGIEKEIQQIKYNFLICFQNVLSEIQKMDFTLQNNYGSLLAKSSSVEQALIYVEKLLDDSLNQLCALNQEECKGEPLLQELLWLCRLFIFAHDAKFITQATAEKIELDIFPDRLLQFLSLEEEISQKSEAITGDSEHMSSPLVSEEECSSPGLLHFQETQDVDHPMVLAAHPEMPSSSYNEPLRTSTELSVAIPSNSEAISSRKGKKKRKAARAAQQSICGVCSNSPEQEEKRSLRFPEAFDPRVLLEVKKRRHIEKILTQLGLQPIRSKGSHTIWQHSRNTKMQTVVPHHPEITQGTRHAIFEQVTSEYV